MLLDDESSNSPPAPSEPKETLSASSLLPVGVSDLDRLRPPPSPVAAWLREIDADIEALEEEDVESLRELLLLLLLLALDRMVVEPPKLATAPLDDARAGSLVADVLIRLIDEDAVAWGGTIDDLEEEVVDDDNGGPEMDDRVRLASDADAVVDAPPVADLGEGALGNADDEGGTGGGGGLGAPAPPPLSSRSFCNTALRLAWKEEDFLKKRW